MKLFICEKPSQAKDIAHVLGATNRSDHCFAGNQLSVTWCIGHLLELAPPDSYCNNLKPWRMDILPIVPNTWNLLPQEKTKKQLTAIGKLLKQATSVVIATDADREGDVIGREVLDYFKFKGPVERLWLSALDEASIKKALATIRPGSSTENLYQAGLGRQRADWLVGMNLTMAVSCLHGVPGQGVLSVGRVQTPTLNVVVNRDLSIEQFKSCDYFTLKVQFTTGRGEQFWANWVIPDELTDEAGRCIKKTIIDETAKAIIGKQGHVRSFNETEKKTPAPLCLSLSEAQKLASAHFGMSAKQTLETAQSLYEKHKATTYPRTDCGYLPESQFNEVSQVLAALSQVDKRITPRLAKCNPRFKSRAWNDKKITAHHGIIPTANHRVDINAMSDAEQRLYGLIRSHYLAQFLGDYVYCQRHVVAALDSHEFKASSHSLKVKGWREALSGMHDEDDDPDGQDNGALPSLATNEALLVEKSETVSCKTKPLPRFTEGTLITAMKSIAKYVDDAHLKKILKDTAGIGTEATRANILETLINRDYLKREGKQLISTAKGRELIKRLPQSITNPATTALWEQTLDSIAQGHTSLADFLDDQSDTLAGMLKLLGQTGKTKPALTILCRLCQKPMYRREGTKGVWWGCSGYPDCKATQSEKNTTNI